MRKFSYNTTRIKDKKTGKWESIPSLSPATDKTLTVENEPADAKIVGDKLKNFSNKIVTCNNYDELLTTKTDKVIVLKDDSYYGSGNMAVYEVQPEGITEGCYRRNDGKYVAPAENFGTLQSVNVPLKYIGNNISTYVGNNSLSYGHNHLFSNNPQSQIDCSSFVTALLRGITYGNSKYSKEENIISNSSQYPILSTKYASFIDECLLSFEIAVFFGAKGQLFSIYNSDGKMMLQPGDLLFAGDNEQSKSYKKINHVMIVLSVDINDGVALVAQAGSAGNSSIFDMQNTTCKLSYVDIDSNQNYFKCFARPTYVKDERINNITSYCITYGDVDTSSGVDNITLARIFPSKKLQTGVYSVKLEGVLPSYKNNKSYIYLRLMHSNGSKNICWQIYEPSSADSGVWVGIFYLDEEEYGNITRIDVMCNAKSQISPETLSIKNAVLADGIAVYSNIFCRPIDIFELGSDSVAKAITNKCCEKEDGIILYADFTIDTDQIKIGNNEIICDIDESKLPEITHALFIEANDNSNKIFCTIDWQQKKLKYVVQNIDSSVYLNYQKFYV